MNEENLNEVSNQAQNLETVVEPTIEQPVEPTIEQPVEPTIEQPVEPTIEQPVEPTIEQPVEPTYNTVEPKTKNTNKKVPGMILCIVVLLGAIIGYFAYTTLNSPKNIFLKSINSGYKKLENSFDDLMNSDQSKLLDEKALTSKANIGINITADESLLDANTKEIINEVNKIKLNSELGYDRTNKEFAYSLGAKYDDSELLTLAAYGTKKNMYIELKNLFDKYIEIPLEDYDALFESQKQGTEDAKYVISTFKDALVASLDKKDFKKSKETIEIDGKKVKTTRINYSLSQEDGYTLSKDTITKLLDNDKFLEKVASITGQTKEEIKTSMQEAKDELVAELESKELNTEKQMVISTFVKGITNKVVGYSFEVEEEDSEKYQLNYFINKDIREFNIFEGTEKLLSGKTTVKNDNESKTVITASGVELTIDKKKEDSKSTYSYEIKNDTAGVSIKGDLVFTNKEETKNEKYTTSFEMTMNFLMNGTKMIGLQITSDGTTEYTDKLNVPNVSNSINYVNLTEDDYNTIINKLMQNKELITLVGKISTYMDNMNKADTYSTSYNY